MSQGLVAPRGGAQAGRAEISNAAPSPLTVVEHDRAPPELDEVVEHAARALGVETAAVGRVVVQQLQRAVDVHVRAPPWRAETVLRREQRLVQQRRGPWSCTCQRPRRRALVAEQLQLARELGVRWLRTNAKSSSSRITRARLEAVRLDDLFPEPEAEVIRVDRERYALAARASGARRPNGT